ncbi:MAG: hypothetical protein R3246_17300 [Acidimicrobiia bacterium]|nr:hypothetical protein [Acidimicrobiia bacterium]
MFERIDQAVTADRREAELVALETVIYRLRHRQAVLIREADADQTALSDGCRTLAEWVAGRLDTDRRTALDLVALARHDNRADPDTVTGSFARTIAVRRLTQAGASDTTVEMAAGMDVGAVHRIATRHHHVTADAERDASAGHYLTLQPSLDETIWRLRGQLDGVDGAAVSQILDETAETHPPPTRRTTRWSLRSKLG